VLLGVSEPAYALSELTPELLAPVGQEARSVLFQYRFTYDAIVLEDAVRVAVPDMIATPEYAVPVPM
jgi:hypothetical protein